VWRGCGKGVGAWGRPGSAGAVQVCGCWAAGSSEGGGPRVCGEAVGAWAAGGVRMVVVRGAVQLCVPMLPTVW